MRWLIVLLIAMLFSGCLYNSQNLILAEGDNLQFSNTPVGLKVQGFNRIIFYRAMSTQKPLIPIMGSVDSEVVVEAIKKIETIESPVKQTTNSI